ncbi:MAG: hypothetical protein JWN70_6535 [Planctomycetaceae bacterium]|nr:hypothetical protein [Planctomycetaceae bacterium]
MTEQRQSTPWLWWTLAGLMLFVAYPLSIGPTVWICRAIGIDNPDHWAAAYVRFLYAPVIIPAQSSRTTDQLLLDYLGFWIGP